MNDFHGFQSPNHTQAPNEFFDHLLSEIETLGELKVTLAAIRQTFGWHRTEAELSLGFLEKATKLSRNTVRQGIKDAIERGTLIEVRPETNKDGAIYAMAMSDEVKKHTVRGVSADPQKLTPTNRVSKTAPPRGGEIASQELTPNKEIVLKEKKEKDVLSEKPTQIIVPEIPVVNCKPDELVESPRTEIQTEIQSLFRIHPEFDWTWLEPLLAEIPDKTLYLETARRLFDLGKTNASFDRLAFAKMLRTSNLRALHQAKANAIPPC